MKYVIYSISFFIFLVLILIYVNISKPVFPSPSFKEEKEEKQELKPFEVNNLYNLPARILYMKVDFQQSRYRIIYKVVVKGVDKFTIFNLKTILDDFKIHYSLIKTKNTEIYIFFKNLKEANSVLNLFKEYNFNIKIEKLKKRI